MSDGLGDPLAVQAAAGRSPRRRGLGVVVLSTAGALLTGVGVAVQTSINGHTGVIVGSPIFATAINHGAALLCGLLIALAINAFPRAWRSIRARRAEFRWWWLLGGLMGFAAVYSIIVITPAIGVVTIAVAITLGQLAGSVIADSGGLGPGGRRHLNVLRLAGIAVAIAAVTVGAVGRVELQHVVLVVVIVVAGVLIAIQQAVNAWWVVITGGEWAVMTVINFAISGLAVGVALAVSNALQPVDFGAMPWWAPLGGIIGAANGVAMAYTVRIIGVLTSMLCVAAGQAVTAIVVDLVVPIDSIGVSAGAILGAALAVVAVGLAGLGSVRRAERGGSGAD